MWASAGVIRLVLLVILGLAAVGWANLIAALILGGAIGAGIRWASEWGWATSVLIGIGAVMVLPVLALLLRRPANVAASAIVLGTPAFLVSRFALDSSTVFAAGDAVALAVLLPLGVVRVLRILGVIEATQAPRSQSPDREGLLRAQEAFRSEAPSTAASSPIRSTTSP